jgi:hypothetical protein
LQEVTFKSFILLNEDDLKDMEIPTGPRKSLLAAIEVVKKHSPFSLAIPSSSSPATTATASGPRSPPRSPSLSTPERIRLEDLKHHVDKKPPSPHSPSKVAADESGGGGAQDVGAAVGTGPHDRADKRRQQRGKERITRKRESESGEHFTKRRSNKEQEVVEQDAHMRIGSAGGSPGRRRAHSSPIMPVQLLIDSSSNLGTRSPPSPTTAARGKRFGIKNARKSLERRLHSLISPGRESDSDGGDQAQPQQHPLGRHSAGGKKDRFARSKKGVRLATSDSTTPLSHSTPSTARLSYAAAMASPPTSPTSASSSSSSPSSSSPSVPPLSLSLYPKTAQGLFSSMSVPTTPTSTLPKSRATASSPSLAQYSFALSPFPSPLASPLTSTSPRVSPTSSPRSSSMSSSPASSPYASPRFDPETPSSGPTVQFAVGTAVPPLPPLHYSAISPSPSPSTSTSTSATSVIPSRSSSFSSTSAAVMSAASLSSSSPSIPGLHLQLSSPSSASVGASSPLSPGSYSLILRVQKEDKDKEGSTAGSGFNGNGSSIGGGGGASSKAEARSELKRASTRLPVLSTVRLARLGWACSDGID